MTYYAHSNDIPNPYGRRLKKRTVRTLPDGTREVIEEFDLPPVPQVQPAVPQPLWTSTPRPHLCPLTDPANADKVMMYYCPVCTGSWC